MALLPLADKPLLAAEMRKAIDAMVSGQVPDSEIADFLRTVAQRGEREDEIFGAVSSLWMHQAAILPSILPELCDTCGTGGDGKGTFNISTLAALVAAAAGVKICKHGNRAASSRCGSADVLEGLGLNLNAAPAQIVRSIKEVGFGFCFAPNFHPAMKALAGVRKSLGIRTIFNFAGPLANPAKQLTFQLVGVSDQEKMWPVAKALQRVGIHHGMVVHSDDGLDEVTTTGNTQVIVFEKGYGADSFDLSPRKFRKIAPARLSELQGDDITTNKRIAEDVLSGKGTPAQRDIVALNAGCVIYVATGSPARGNETKIVAGIQSGIDEALEILRTSRAWKVLQDAIKISHDPG